VTDPAGGAGLPLKEVHDLCASIQQLYKNAPCIGFLFDSKNKLRGTYAVDTVIEKRISPTEFVSLEQLLSHPPTVNGRPAKLSKKERYSLALTLASSTLQLNATPWFRDMWGGKDITFPRAVTGNRVADLSRPYIAPQLTKDSNASTNGRVKPRAFQNKNMVLLALAVALLELYFGISAESRLELEHQPTEAASNPWALCAIAYNWADEEQENLSAAFSSAVSE